VCVLDWAKALSVAILFCTSEPVPSAEKKIER
jgi:hypothetical protein